MFVPLTLFDDEYLVVANLADGRFRPDTEPESHVSCQTRERHDGCCVGCRCGQVCSCHGGEREEGMFCGGVGEAECVCVHEDYAPCGMG